MRPDPKKGKVSILGAGPAGLTAAVVLARRGMAVDVYEKAAHVGARFRGDLQGLENWTNGDFLEELTEMGLAVNFELTPVHHIDLSDGHKTDSLRFSAPLFYVVKRGSEEGSLDRGLLGQARDAGVNVRFRQTSSPESVNLVATGPARSRRFATARGGVFACDRPDTVAVLINEETAPGGYAYLLIARGRACLCVTVFQAKADIKLCYARARAYFSERFDLSIADEHPVGGYVNFGFAGDPGPGFVAGVRAVGEAAGLQDFLWGFGARLAMQSGAAAARDLLGEERASARARFFRGLCRAGIVNRFLWEARRGQRYDFILKQALGARGAHGRLRSFYRFNILQKIVYPLARRAMRGRYGHLF